MGVIKRLPDKIINKIAAGEVIERPASVVKELIENAIDANAKTISILLREGGIKYINIYDDGDGIAEEDLLLSVERHATSKINDYDDIGRLSTLGFRGEALASIANVSHLTIKSLHKNANTAFKIEILGGECLCEPQPVGHPKGTSVSVQDLFFNLPARKKHMNNSSTEVSKIAEIVTKFALLYPEIRFSLENNGKYVLKTYGGENFLSPIYHIYGRDLEKNLVSINYEDENLSIQGYISNVHSSKRTRKHQVVAINRRIINNKVLYQQIEESYRKFIPQGLFPVIVLNINIKPELIDPNIHPTKSEVKCFNEELLLETVDKAIQQSFEEYLDDNLYNTEEDETPFVVSEEFYDAFNYKIKGQLYGTYIIVEMDDRTLLFDQHAAHERILYEQLKESFGNKEIKIQETESSIIMNLSPTQYLKIKDKEDKLLQLGFIIEDFGINTIAVRGIPEGMDVSNVANAIEEILDTNNNSSNWLEKMITSVSCKSAIKANTELTKEQMEEIVSTIFEKRLTNCPHGRPIYITLPLSELERKFKRVI